VKRSRRLKATSKWPLATLIANGYSRRNPAESPSGSASGSSRLRRASFEMTVAKTPARFGVAKRFSGVTRCPVMADLMKADELKTRLKKIPEWELEKKHIERTFEFDDFADAIDFVNAVAEVAEEEEHHPDIDIRYNKVRLVLSTHSKGGLTELDFGLAERIDTLAE
jgi:4a-hydroxytetrahydrobiopterin dehydratase